MQDVISQRRKVKLRNTPINVLKIKLNLASLHG